MTYHESSGVVVSSELITFLACSSALNRRRPCGAHVLLRVHGTRLHTHHYNYFLGSMPFGSCLHACLFLDVLLRPLSLSSACCAPPSPVRAT